MKTIWKVSVYALLILGIIHVVCTPLFYSQFNTDTIWFISCGFLLVFQGFINILTWVTQIKVGYIFAIIANLISLLLVIALLWMKGEIQAYIGTLLATLALSGSLYYWRKNRT
jgi:hypothetical protein